MQSAKTFLLHHAITSLDQFPAISMPGGRLTTLMERIIMV